MKYWRGYLFAAIMVAITFALTQFAQAHNTLVDIVYPYMTRMVQGSLADWSAAVPFCLWQAGVIFLIAGAVASAVLMVLFRWSPIQWFGWVLAVASLFVFLNTAIFGLNDYAGSIADDVHLEMQDYTVAELAAAANHYRDLANELAPKVSRNAAGEPNYAVFDDLTVQASVGFRALTYEQNMPVFAGSTVPVKKLGWSGRYTAKGISGVSVGLTGEAAVNPQVPTIAMPFAICQEMCHRMSITKGESSKYAAFLACEANTSTEFRYTAYCIAYYHCYNALVSIPTDTAQSAASKLHGGANQLVKDDMRDYEAFFGPYTEAEEGNTMADMLTCRYIQEFITPLTQEEEDPFNPRDPEMVDIAYTEPVPTSLEEWEEHMKK